MAGQYAIAVDVGGTFTDASIVDVTTGQRWSSKTSTTPSDPSIGFIAAVEDALALSGAQPSEVARILHGTTIATNAILESKGAPTGLVTTRGFKYVLEIGRHDAPRRGSILSWVKPPRPVPPELVVEVTERIAVSGEVLRPLDLDDCRAAARFFKQRKIETIAICFLHSYAFPEHERQARAAMLEEHPEAWISLSSDVLPVFREYERTMATVLNSYVMPKVSTYMGRLREELAKRSITAPLLIMKSNGGVIGVESVTEQPATTALSGPAAGVVGAHHVGRQARFDDLISIDVGGTSADVCLIRKDGAELTTEGHVGPWPFATPMVDIHAIGAGGGSIASVTASGNLVVGPASAGADPGPAGYGRGGTLPTVTDAHVVLGRLPREIAGGGLRLDADAAREAIRRHVAEPLGIDVEAAASGILAIINNNMTGAIHVLTVERGIDPADLALVGFGGAGPLHAASLAKLLGVSTVVIGQSPGVLSTIGLIASDVRNDFARSSPVTDPTSPRIAGLFRELDEQATAWLVREQVPEERRAVTWHADLRYPNQVFELTVDVARGVTSPAALDAMVAAFHARHEQLFTYASAGAPVELVTLRASAVGRLGGDELLLQAPSEPTEAPAAATRPVFFEEAGAFVDCPVHVRSSLAVGAHLVGPAVIDQMDTTTVILPGQAAHVDPAGNVIITNPGSHPA